MKDLIAELLLRLGTRLHTHTWDYYDKGNKLIQPVFRECTKQDCKLTQWRTPFGWEK